MAKKLPMESVYSTAGEPKLRHVEKDILIPKIMKDKAKELCSEQVKDFTKCCKDTGFLMVVKCQKENKLLKECLTGYRFFIKEYNFSWWTF
ncbi:COX assembly mitochondrial protein homolog isoform X2 [Protobothrops mucrosquamatus]|uniref:COX assembly mitochondrial protein homolog isoform X2 n=1 Tax=Protobothrops mucrosquamatus TaxID=103944 RepID=UPI0007756DF1|nr:COX assembly mitochondrial protein homolog isoform X2 [Protobothrops mucrosquamatus]